MMQNHSAREQKIEFRGVKRQFKSESNAWTLIVQIEVVPKLSMSDMIL